MIELINLLIEELPVKDRIYGQRFVHERNFRSLLELIQSDIEKIKTYKKKKIINPDFENVDIDRLKYFENIVYEYRPDLLEEDEELNKIYEEVN